MSLKERYICLEQRLKETDKIINEKYWRPAK